MYVGQDGQRIRPGSVWHNVHGTLAGGTGGLTQQHMRMQGWVHSSSTCLSKCTAALTFSYRLCVQMHGCSDLFLSAVFVLANIVRFAVSNSVHTDSHHQQ
jgi:hypothetical protein